jgi:hypothetical protein
MRYGIKYITACKDKYSYRFTVFYYIMCYTGVTVMSGECASYCNEWRMC